MRGSRCAAPAHDVSFGRLSPLYELKENGLGAENGVGRGALDEVQVSLIWNVPDREQPLTLDETNRCQSVHVERLHPGAHDLELKDDRVTRRFSLNTVADPPHGRTSR